MLFPGNSRWNPYLSSGDKSSSEMTVRRNRYAATVPPGYFASTKGHSALRKWSYYPPSRAAVYAEDIYVPTDYVRPRSYYDTTREENEIRRDVNSELIYTSNLIDDSYDVAAKSRNRDQSLLREASRALVDTETYTSPRSSVTSRRIRASTVAPRATSVAPRAVSCPPSRRSNQVVVVLTSPAFKGGPRVVIADTAMAKREQSLPPPILPSPAEQLERRVSARRVIETTAGPFLLPRFQPYLSIYQPYISMYRPHYVRRYFATTRDVIPARYPFRVLGSSQKRKKYRKAALVGNKVEVTTPRRRRPRSDYAANKLRELRREDRELEVEAIPQQATTSLKATTVTPNYIDGGRCYRDEEGNITEPKNLMSWKSVRY